MVSALVHGANGSGPGRGQCVVFLGKTLSQLSQCRGMELRGSDLRWTSIPSRGE